MEERKAYFDLVLCKEVILTDEEVLERGGFARFVSLGKWNLFYEDNIDKITNDIQVHYEYKKGVRTPFYTVRTNTGAASFNTYSTAVQALRISTVNLYLEKRAEDIAKANTDAPDIEEAQEVLDE